MFRSTQQFLTVSNQPMLYQLMRHTTISCHISDPSPLLAITSHYFHFPRPFPVRSFHFRGLSQSIGFCRCRRRRRRLVCGRFRNNIFHIHCIRVIRLVTAVLSVAVLVLFPMPSSSRRLLKNRDIDTNLVPNCSGSSRFIRIAVTQTYDNPFLYCQHNVYPREMLPIV